MKLFRKVQTIISPIIIKSKKGITISGKVSFVGHPLIKATQGSIIIGNNVTLNSRNLGYHLNMFTPIKIYTSNFDAKIKIGDNSRINGTCIHAYSSIDIGKNCLIAANCQIFDSNRHELHFESPEKRLITTTKASPIVIEDNVWIGTGSIVLPGITIGEGSVIAAGSVVTKDIPSFCLAGGNPARVLKSYKENLSV